MLTHISDTPLTYDWDGEILAALDFPACTAHAGTHSWKYIKKAAGEKSAVQGDLDKMDEGCSDFDAL